MKMSNGIQRISMSQNNAAKIKSNVSFGQMNAVIPKTMFLETTNAIKLIPLDNVTELNFLKKLSSIVVKSDNKPVFRPSAADANSFNEFFIKLRLGEINPPATDGLDRKADIHFFDYTPIIPVGKKDAPRLDITISDKHNEMEYQIIEEGMLPEAANLFREIKQTLKNIADSAKI